MLLPGGIWKWLSGHKALREEDTPLALHREQKTLMTCWDQLDEVETLIENMSVDTSGGRSRDD